MTARIAFVVTLVLAAMLLMTGCDDRKCLDYDTTVQPHTTIINGKPHVSVVPVTYCARYEESK